MDADIASLKKQWAWIS